MNWQSSGTTHHMSIGQPHAMYACCGMVSTRGATASWVCALLVTATACAPAVSSLAPSVPPCLGGGPNGAIRWIAPSGPGDQARTREGCESVGPVALTSAAAHVPNHGVGTLFVISWNVGIGHGHVDKLVQQLTEEERRADRPKPDFILLLQEAYRSSSASRRRDVRSIAADLDLNLAYVPSMPNGRSDRTPRGDDRGNAILSTLPLREITAIELPLVRQRRVAVVARVDVDGSPLTVVSVHRDTRRELFSGSVFSGPPSRERQAAALAEALAYVDTHGPIIIGGDFNSVGGVREPAIRLMERSFARLQCGNPITQKWGYALDYVFASDPMIVEGCSRVDGRYGSDHHPLMARVSRRILVRPMPRGAPRR
ncbi:MAG: endonuclease/exonuclease/phosphatase family protein [Acidobacteriota bacterium]